MPDQGRRQFFRGMVTGALGGAASIIPTATVAAEPEVVVVEKPTGVLVVEAKRAFDYGRQEIDRGEIFALTGHRNDALLVRIGYVEIVDPALQRLPCACGRLFVDERKLRAHKARDHQRPEPREA